VVCSEQSHLLAVVNLWLCVNFQNLGWHYLCLDFLDCRCCWLLSFFEDVGNGCEDQNDQSNIKEILRSNPEENSNLILLDRDNTRYSGSDAAAAVRSNNRDNIIRAGGGDDIVVAEGVDNWVLDNFGSNQVMGDVGNDSLVAVDGNNAVDQKRIRS
jgi:hypothetical protein